MSARISGTSELRTRVYIGGGRCELARVERFIERCQLAGCIVTHDWTQFAREHEHAAKVGHEPPMSDERRHAAWKASLDAIGEADVCVFLSPREGVTRGMWAEIGAAQAMGVAPIYVGHDDDSIVTSMCTVVADDDAAFAALEAS